MKKKNNWNGVCILTVFLLLSALCLTSCMQSDAAQQENNEEMPQHTDSWSSMSFESGDDSNDIDNSALEEDSGKEIRENREDEPRAVVLFASDFQHRDGWGEPPDTLSAILDSVYSAGIRPDNAVFCGDYTTEHGHNDYNANPHDAVDQIKRIFESKNPDWPTEDMIFIQGNHDEMTEDLSEPGLHDFDDYLVYVLNTQSEFPWRQGKKQLEKEVSEGAHRLRQCLEELENDGEKRPVFIAGHVPLHFSGRTSSLQGTGDNLYSAVLFDVINQYGQKLNLVYLYGHNHSRGWDSYLGGSCVFRTPGQWILIPRPEEGERVTSNYTKETISFTYLNAGYVGYFSSAGGEDTLNCTICSIYDDHLSFSRYSEDGIHILSAEGTPNPAKDDTELIPEAYYGKEINSPQEVKLIEEEQDLFGAA